MNWDRLVEVAVPSILSAGVAWLWASTKKVSRSDLRDTTDRIKEELDAIRLELKGYATKNELQIQLSSIQQSLQDLRELVKTALERRG